MSHCLPPQPPLSRRALMALALGAPGAALAAGPAEPAAAALPLRTLVFPRDHGAHPDLRTEWWYLTGRVTSGGRVFGFQLTFFRSRVDATQGIKSALAARQLVMAHAAVSDLSGGKLWHDQRIGRAAGHSTLDTGYAGEQDTDLRLGDWRLLRQTTGGAEVYTANVRSGDFSLALSCRATQPLLLQGDRGLSRKGPQAQQASYYYSQPQLAVSGELGLQGQRLAVDGKAWLDHEWSEALLHEQATGWDWIGMNLHDGSALTAFRLRQADGSRLWDGGSFRTAGGHQFRFSPGEVVFSPQRRWKSPISQASYPVEWAVRTPVGIYTVRALLDPQEIDGRSSAGAVYWEGLAELIDSHGRQAGYGYLEMTGYAQALKL